jgi:hypothetical protein
MYLCVYAVSFLLEERRPILYPAVACLGTVTYSCSNSMDVSKAHFFRRFGGRIILTAT